MEQKQLDEEESFFGEEFIDDEDLLEKSPKVQPEEVVEQPKKKSTSKKSAKKSASKETDEEKVSSEESKETIIEPTAASVDEKANLKESGIEITPAKESSSSGTREEKSEFSAKDPWADDDEGEGMFKEVSTWKAITGIVIILFIFSVFTQGFQFSEGAATGAVTGIPLSEAEQKALNYVNNNLLQPPFLAELESSEEIEGLYKVTLSVAGQNVDSYITKNGKLFFPQGFDTSQDLADQLDLAGETDGVEDQLAEVGKVVEEALSGEEEAAEVPEEESVEEVKEETEESPEEVEEALTEPEVEEPAGPQVLEIAMQAKKWLFTPSRITVNKGDTVKFFIEPSGLEFTFAVPDFDVEQEVVGITAVEFTVDKAGRFEFLCSSCEARRGMTGTLIVE